MFKYLPGKDWPVEVKHKIDMMRQKNSLLVIRLRFKERLHVRKTKLPLDLQWLLLLRQLVPTLSSIWYPTI